MTISALALNPIGTLGQPQSPFQQIRQDFRQLASSLHSGDLNGAQSAYDNIEQVLGLSPGPGAASSGAGNLLQNDFAAIGQALQSGNLGQAQSAFSQLVNDFKSGRQAQQDYTQLANALQSGDVTGAQSDYSNLLQLVQAYKGPSHSTNAIQTDFATLSQDLQTGNLTQSQTDFSQLQSDLQNATQNPAQQSQTGYGLTATALQLNITINIYA